MTTVYRFPIRNRTHANAETLPASAHPQKGYWIAHIDVAEPQRYSLYSDVYEDAFARYGGHYVVRGGSQLLCEGALKRRTVIVEFETLQVALDCYNSIEGQEAKALRTAFSACDLVIVEGAAEA